MSLKAKLEQIRAGFESQAPPEALALMAETTEALVRTGQAERALGLGQLIPAFELMDIHDQAVSSKALLQRGPLVLSFFRGHW